MKYLHILLACANEPWAMERGKLLTVSQFIVFQALGGKYSSAELEAKALTPRRDEIIRERQGAVAILPVTGVLLQRMNLFDDISGGTSTQGLANAFRSLLTDNDVKAIVLDFDSPGGGVFGIEELAQEMFASRGIKPVIAQVNSMCASAAYWLACQADEIVVTPGGQAGSVGVYTIHEDISKMLEQEGVKETLIFNGKFKTEANPYEPLSDEAAAFIQKRVDDTASRFVRDVARGRGVTEAEVLANFGQGRMYGAQDLVKRGMVDRVGSMEDTLERFGVALRPASMQQNAQRSRDLVALRDKLAAGERPQEREWEKGLRGLDLTHSQAVRAVALNRLGKPPGEPETEAATETNVAAVAVCLNDLRETLGRFPKLSNR